MFGAGGDLMDQAIEEIRRVNPELAALFAGMDRQHNRAVFARTVAVVSIILLAVVGWFSALQYNKAQDASDAAAQAAEVVRQAAVDNCQRSVQKGGVRRELANTIQDDIDSSENSDLSAFFPQIPPDQLQALIEKRNDARRARIKHVLSINCEASFPKP